MSPRFLSGVWSPLLFFIHESNKEKEGWIFTSLFEINLYFPFGFGVEGCGRGGLFPLPPPEGFVVVLGALTGLVVDFPISFLFIIFPTL